MAQTVRQTESVQKNRLDVRTPTPRYALCDKALAVLHFPQKVQYIWGQNTPQVLKSNEKA